MPAWSTSLRRSWNRVCAQILAPIAPAWKRSPAFFEALEYRCLLSAYSFNSGNVECTATSDAWTESTGPSPDNTGLMGSSAQSQTSYQGSTASGNSSGNVTITNNAMVIQATATATSTITGPYPYGDTYVTGTADTLINSSIGLTLNSAASITIAGSFSGNLGSNYSVAELQVAGFSTSGTAGTINTTLQLPAGTYDVYADVYVNSLLEWGNGTSLSLNAGLDITITVDQKPADLTGQFTGTLPASLPGKTISPHLQIENGFFASNVGDAAGTLTDNYYLSKTTTLDSSAILLGSTSQAVDVPANSTTTDAPTLTIPSDTIAGNYFLIASINADQAIPETNYANNITTTPLAIAEIPTVVTLGNLCNNVYTGTQGAGDYQAVVPYQTDPHNKGFGAEAYATADGHSVVIAFRGTVADLTTLASYKDLFADLSFGGSIPNALLTSQVADAVAFLKKIKSLYPNASITLTGHSLGGAVAQLVGEAAGLNTVTFNAPGAGQFFSSGVPGSPLYSVLQPIFGNAGGSLTNYRLYGEQVSLVGQPIGTQVTLADPAGTPASISSNTSDQPLNLVQNLIAFLHLHQLGSPSATGSGILSQINLSPLPVVSSQGQPNDAGASGALLQAVSTVATVQGALLNFTFPGVLPGVEKLLDPAEATNYVLAGAPGSPDLASLALPPLPGVASYNVRYESGGTWSAFQVLQPGTVDTLATSVQAIEFDPLDASSQPVLLTDSFLIDATFASAGTFVGSLAESNGAITDAPAKLVFARQPASIVAGQTITPIVAVEDAKGLIDPINNATVTIALSSTAGGATLGGTLSVPVVNGMAAFTDLTLSSAHQYTLLATLSGLPAAVSKPFTVTPDLSTSHLAFATSPTPTIVGDPLAPALTVQAVDQFGNVITPDRSKVILSPTTGTFTGASALTLTGGKATFSNLLFKTAGTYLLTATPATTSTLASQSPISLAATISQATTAPIVSPAVKAQGYIFGAAIPLSIKLTSNAPASIPFTGTPTLVINATDSIPALSLSAAGQVRFTLPVLDAGTYTCQIVYPGDANHSSASSPTFLLGINPATTTTALSISSAAPVFGQRLTLTATVKSSSAAGAPRSGSVEFLADGSPLQTVILNSSSPAAISFAPPATGSHTFQALYLATPDYAASTTALLRDTVAKDKTTLALSPSSADPLRQNQTFNLDVQLSAVAPGSGSSAGDLVVIKDNATLLGTLTLDAGGAASLMGLSFTTSGTHRLLAAFAGDATKLISLSPQLTLTVT